MPVLVLVLVLVPVPDPGARCSYYLLVDLQRTGASASISREPALGVGPGPLVHLSRVPLA